MWDIGLNNSESFVSPYTIRGFSSISQFAWPLVKMSKVVELHYGKSLTVAKRIPGGIPVYGSNGITGWHDEILSEGPAVILGRKGMGHLGVEWCEGPFWVIDTAYYTSFDLSRLDPRFFYYFTNFVGLDHLKDGTSNPSLTRATFSQQYIPTPPLKEQKAIAAVLSAFDDKIELNRQMNATLEETARALFKSWFVHFDPVRRNQAGQPNQPYDNLFPDRLVVDVNGSEVPAGWQVSTIGKEVDAVGGGTPSTKNPDYWEGGTIDFTTPKDFSNLESPVLLETARCITEKGLNKISSGLLPVGAVLLSSRAPVGYLAINEVPVAINQGFIAMLCNKTLSKHYVLFWAMENMHLIEQRASGTTFREISKQNFRPIEVVVPPKAAVEKFDTIVGSLYQKIVGNEKESRILAGLRDTLLPRLMSGRVRVPVDQSYTGDSITWMPKQ
jgi:type I restriction enzyme, S subunit